jgi:DNA-binding transcriptional ArsR family regulator
MQRRAMVADLNRSRQRLACLTEPSRFRIALTLIRGESCVSSIALEVGLSQSCTTRHLQALEREGLVARERAGKRVLYRLRFDRPEIESVRALIEPPGGAPPAPGATGDPPPPGAPGAGGRRRPRADAGRSATAATSSSAVSSPRLPGPRDGAPEARSGGTPEAPSAGDNANASERGTEGVGPGHGAAASASGHPVQRPGELEDYLL